MRMAVRTCGYPGIALPSVTTALRHRQGLRGAYHIYGMYNVLFHVILFAYLLASLFFWLSMGLRQRWFLHLAHGLLGGGFALQTFILGYRLYIQTLPWWGEMATSLGLLSWAIVVVYLAGRVALPYRRAGVIYCAARFPRRGGGGGAR